MKKRTIVILLCLFALLLTGCSGSKTVNTKAEAKQMAEEFYNDLLSADNIKMTSYLDDEATSIFVKDGDKMYVETLDPEYGYGYYLFKENDTKYLIADDGSVFEDEATYDLSLETIKLMLDFNVLGYFEADDDSIKYTAEKTSDDELLLTVKGKSEGNDYTINSIGKKNDGKLASIANEITSGTQTYKTNCKFEYDQHVELPEYSLPKTYTNLPHVESPYKTYGEIINKLGPDDTLFYSFYDNELVVIDEVDGRHYQFSSVIYQETVDAFSALDPADENYDQKLHELISNLEIEDCIDFTDQLIPQEQLDTYVGKSIADLIAEGFETTGYAFYENENHILLDKDLMCYRVDVTIPDTFDINSEFEYDALNDFTIKAMTFEYPEYAALPMR